MNRLVAAAAMIPAGLMAQPRSHVGGVLDVYFVPSANIEESRFRFEEDGDGFGARVRAPISEVLQVSGEYQSTSYDDTGRDLDQVRAGLDVGMGYSGSLVFEYVAMDLGDVESDGFGIHWRFLTALSDTLDLFGQVGYLGLEEDRTGEDLSGGEVSIGAALAFAPNMGGFIDYRLTSLEDDRNNETDFSDFRIGVRFGF